MDSHDHTNAYTIRLIRLSVRIEFHILQYGVLSFLTKLHVYIGLKGGTSHLFGNVIIPMLCADDKITGGNLEINYIIMRSDKWDDTCYHKSSKIKKTRFSSYDYENVATTLLD